MSTDSPTLNSLNRIAESAKLPDQHSLLQVAEILACLVDKEHAALARLIVQRARIRYGVEEPEPNPSPEASLPYIRAFDLRFTKWVKEFAPNGEDPALRALSWYWYAIGRSTALNSVSQRLEEMADTVRNESYLPNHHHRGGQPG
jgi:hypothetical protein